MQFHGIDELAEATLRRSRVPDSAQCPLETTNFVEGRGGLAFDEIEEGERRVGPWRLSGVKVELVTRGRRHGHSDDAVSDRARQR
jgi:hypothetical protein